MTQRSPLVPCPACARHVLASEPSCPFCASSLPRDLAARAPAPAKGRMSRWQIFSFNAKPKTEKPTRTPLRARELDGSALAVAAGGLRLAGLPQEGGSNPYDANMLPQGPMQQNDGEPEEPPGDPNDPFDPNFQWDDPSVGALYGLPPEPEEPEQPEEPEEPEEPEPEQPDGQDGGNHEESYGAANDPGYGTDYGGGDYSGGDYGGASGGDSSGGDYSAGDYGGDAGGGDYGGGDYSSGDNAGGGES